jgi:hypothetical protein
MDFKMVDTTDVSDSNSHNLTCNINGVAASSCENCIALKNHVYNLILDLEAADLNIKLLQEGGNTTDVPEVVKPVKTVSPVI